MKTRIISLIFITSLVFLFTGKLMAQGGIEEELFNEAFPELQGELKLDPNVTDLKPEALEKLRGVVEKIDNAVKNDLNAFQYGALTSENALVFEYKRLKKAKKELDIEKLVKLLTAEKAKIRAYMGDKAKYGISKEECYRNIALFQQSTKSKKWDEAYKYWNVLFHFYPRSTKMIYSKGSDVIEYKFNQSKDKIWIDTLMMLYEQRIEFKFFGEKNEYPEGYIRGRQAVDLLKHDKDAVEKAYSLFNKSVDLQGKNSEDAVLLSFMQATEGMFVKGKIDPAEVVDNYSKLIKVLEEKLKKSQDKELTEKAIAGVTQIFMGSKASTCEQLLPAFQKRFDKNQNDIEQLEKIGRMLAIKECTDSKLFSDVIIKIDELRPSALSKYGIALRYAKEENYEKATEYMNEAIKLETVDSLKARNYFKLAQFSEKMGKKSEARTHALKAASLKSNFGAPYILIATMYASSGCSQLASPEGELHNVGYWAAVDKLVKAKSVDPSVAEAASKLIGRYSGGYPNAERAFMIGVTKGRTVKVGCWINETTTARF